MSYITVYYIFCVVYYTLRIATYITYYLILPIGSYCLCISYAYS